MAAGVTTLNGAPLRKTLSRRAIRALRGLAYSTIFAANPVLRRVIRAWLWERLARIADSVDDDFYLAQLPPGAARVRAARDPELHYWLIGRGEGRWSNRSAVRQSLIKPLQIPDQPILDGGSVLALDHGRGGGSSRMLGLYLDRLVSEGLTVITPQRVGQKTPLFLFPDGAGFRPLDLVAQEADVVALARSMGVRRLVINHMIDLPVGAAAWLGRFAAAIGASYEVLLHDYYFACPRVDLIANDGRFCALAAVERCRSCLTGSGPELRSLDPRRWREESWALLADAALVLAPSHDLADRMAAAFPGVRIDVWEPENDESLPFHAPPPLVKDEDMRVVILGALNHPKGQTVVLNLARELSRRRASVRLTLLGPAADPARLVRAGVRVHGRYRREDIDHLLSTERPHLIFFPAIWPETWSFTLTEALRSSAEIMAFDIGAIADRLRRLQRGRLLSYRLHDDARALCETIVSMREKFLAENIT